MVIDRAEIKIYSDLWLLIPIAEQQFKRVKE